MLAKVDSTVEKSLSTEFNVNGYPTLYIFRNGKKFDYKGPRDAEGIFLLKDWSLNISSFLHITAASCWHVMIFFHIHNFVLGISKYMLEQAEAALKKIATVREAQQFMRKDDVTIIGFFSDGKAELLDSLSDAGQLVINKRFVLLLLSSITYITKLCPL